MSKPSIDLSKLHKPHSRQVLSHTAKTKSVLVTGASGFIGSAFLRIFGSVSENIGYHLIPMVREPMGLENEVILDFNDKDFWLKARELSHIDAIVHLGARVDFNCDFNELFVPNVRATGILANWARDIGAYFIFASTIMVYGRKFSSIVRRGNPINLGTAYAESKWMAEKIIGASDIKHLILRLAGVYGNDGSQSLEINRAITQAQKGELPILFGEGKGKRNYVYVVDLVNMIAYWLKSQTTGTHLVAGTEAISIADMLQSICDTFMAGQNPIHRDGDSNSDQIIEPSKICWRTRKFEDALQHMKLWWG